MNIKRKIVYLIIFLLMFNIINIILSNKVFGVYKTTDLNLLDQYKYRGILPFIQELQLAYPNWSFTILNTELDWNSVINAETTSNHRRSLTQNTDPAWLCPECGLTSYDSGWYGASRQAVEFYMDPRNWLNGKNIFSFEVLSYNPSIHNIDGVKAILRGSFMDRDSITYIDTAGNAQIIYKSYAQIIMEAAQESGVSPYHLASRLRQEQGAGDSPLISGTYSGYVGYYNYFNIGANGDGVSTIIVNGLKYASSNERNPKWTSPELAIKGGAKFIASGYIGQGQDTLYLEKYNVNTTNIESAASHQYMQNISAHISEGLSVYRAYNSIGVIGTNFNFLIPVYENMPLNISPRPTTTTNLVTENVITDVPILRLRESNSTSSTNLADLPVGTNLLRIETAKSIVNGYYWDKVIYFNGTQAITGYVARNYIYQIPDYITTNDLSCTSACAILKNGPGINTEPKQILDMGTELTIIDKMTFPVDNIIWYRVRLADGTNGYVASNFIEQNNSHEEAPITGEVYRIEGENLLTLPGAKIEQIEGATIEGEVLGTGAILNVNGTRYTVVMLGDTNGDGRSTPADGTIILRNYVGNLDLNNEKIKASDTNRDGRLTPADSTVILRKYVGVGQIGF